MHFRQHRPSRRRRVVLLWRYLAMVVDPGRRVVGDRQGEAAVLRDRGVGIGELESLIERLLTRGDREESVTATALHKCALCSEPIALDTGVESST